MFEVYEDEACSGYVIRSTDHFADAYCRKLMRPRPLSMFQKQVSTIQHLVSPSLEGNNSGINFIGYKALVDRFQDAFLDLKPRTVVCWPQSRVEVHGQFAL